jgi:hypothetical protein
LHGSGGVLPWGLGVLGFPVWVPPWGPGAWGSAPTGSPGGLGLRPFSFPAGVPSPSPTPAVRFPCGGVTLVFNHVALAARVPGGVARALSPRDFPILWGVPSYLAQSGLNRSILFCDDVQACTSSLSLKLGFVLHCSIDLWCTSLCATAQLLFVLHELTSLWVHAYSTKQQQILLPVCLSAWRTAYAGVYKLVRTSCCLSCNAHKLVNVAFRSFCMDRAYKLVRTIISCITG